MRKKVGIAPFVFYGLSAFMAVVIVLSLIGALTWINKPFAGFMLYDFPSIGTMSMKDWQGRQAGLGLMERIVSVDGQEVWRGKDVVKTLSGREPWSSVEYVVEKDGALRHIMLPVTVFSVRDFFLVFLATFLGGGAVFGLGFIVYLLKPNTHVSWVFFGLCFFLGLYMITAFDSQSTYYFAKFQYLSLCLMSACFFHLGSIFPEKKKVLTRFPKLEYIIYVPSVLLVIYYQLYLIGYKKIITATGFGWLPAYKQVAYFNQLFLLFCILSLIVFVLHSVFRASNIMSRQRARMILFGVTIAFAPSVLIMLAAVIFKFKFPWNYLVFFVIFFPASIAYSISKHNLFDADAIIKRTVGYFIVTGIIIGMYAGVTVFFNVFMGHYQVAQSKAFPIIFTLGVILFFNPLRDRIQSLVDRLFFRKEYDYGEIIDKISSAIASLMDLSEILKRLMQTFMQDMFINTGSVVLRSPDGDSFKVYIADGEEQASVENVVIDGDAPLIEIFEKEKRILTRYDILEDPKYKEVSESCQADFDALHSNLIVPLIFQDKLIGLLNLGEKKSGKMYNREDVDLLGALANQGAVAIENARLFKENLEKQRMEEELNIARDLQTSMLPAESPQIEGLEIAAYSMSAMEVGGDFYDFIEMGENSVGLVVGDVTGKSVSGALVMSFSRSIFRMLSEENLSVGEIMLRANRRIKKDIKTGMFVALLYAVMDSAKRVVTLCSAGQTQPVHFSSETGETTLVETKGDTFPLGILEEVDYQETDIQLSAGDSVVFYTDGIVEAMNTEKDMFGFDRLLSVVKEFGLQGAENILKGILDNVEKFTGEAAQHDDLTVIIVSIQK